MLSVNYATFRARKVLLKVVVSFIVLCVSAVTPAAHASKSEVSLSSKVSENARREFNSFLRHAPINTPNVNFIIDPLLNPVYASQIRSDVFTNVGMWSELRNIEGPMNVYAAPTQNFSFVYEYLKQDLAPQGLEFGWLDKKAERAREEPTGFFGGAAPGDTKTGNAVLMVYVPNGTSPTDAHWKSLTSHEYVHVAQRSVLKGTMAPMQCWVREGLANFIGWSYSGRGNLTTYVRSWKAQLQDLENERQYSVSQRLSRKYWENWFVASERQDIRTDCDPTQNYVIGALAFQYLYGTYGYEKVSTYLRNLVSAIGPCGDGSPTYFTTCMPARNDAFMQSFGISLRDIYPKFAAHIVTELRWFTTK